MAAIAFDPLEYTHQLEASGVPREQAEVHAKAMTAMFLHNFDALVTKDYLDTRFSEFATRVEAAMDKRFAEVELRFANMESRMDTRFVESEARTDVRLAQLEARMDTGFAKSDARMDTRFARLQVIGGVILVAVAIPLLQSFWSLLG